MTRNVSKLFLFVICVFAGATVQAQSPINHIVVLVQENRSFDSHFGQLGAYRAANGYGAATDIDGLPLNSSNKNDEGTSINSYHIRTSCIENISPDWAESHGDFNLNQSGSNTFLGDGYVHNAEGLAKYSGFYDVEGRRAMGYYDATDLPYYYFMASNFATSDRWFSPLSSNSNPNRTYLFAATSHGHVHDPGTFSSDTIPNIFQLLDRAGITWKIYYQETDPATGAPDTFLSRFQPFYSQHTANVVPDSQYFADLRNGTLPQVAYLEEQGGLDEHPGATIPGDVHSGNDVQYGAQFAAQHINAFTQSSSWKDGVFFLTYDEAGGLYDHVAAQPAVHPDGLPPSDLTANDNAWVIPQGNFNRTGFRVPLIVISPFAKKSYVSHTIADYTAILKFIENRFALPSLTNRDAAQPNMLEFFDFANPAWPTPPLPPDQPLTLGCNNTNLADYSQSTGTITGRVTKADGTTAIQGATVSYSNGTASTAANGDYTLTGVPAGSVQLTASANGYQSATQTVGVTAGATTTAANFALQAAAVTTGTITGSVSNGTAGIQGATVSYSGGSATTSSSGSYSLFNVPAGNVTITAAATGYQSATQTVSVTAGATTTAPTFRLMAGSTCSAPSAPGVIVCSPLNGSTATSPVNFLAKATPAAGASISAMFVYVDDVTVYQQASSADTVNIYVTIASGTHNIRTQVWDSSGALYKAGSTITVSSSTSAAGVNLSPSSLTFGTQQTGTSSGSQTTTLTNNGGSPLTISNIAASGDFAQTNNCPASLNGGANCSILVTLKPTMTGTRTGSITITDSATGSPHTVSLSGTGTSTSSCNFPGAAGVAVCSPTSGATVSSPVNFVAKATPAGGASISAMWVYVDDMLVYQGSSNSLNINVAIASGAHNIRTQVWDSSGALYKAGADINVSP